MEPNLELEKIVYLSSSQFSSLCHSILKNEPIPSDINDILYCYKDLYFHVIDGPDGTEFDILDDLE